MSWFAVGTAVATYAGASAGTAVAVGAVAAGTGAAISASSKNKAAAKARGGLDGVIAKARQDPAGYFGEKLDFTEVDYTPLYQTDPGYGNSAGAVTAGNQRNLPASTKLATDTNRAITSDALERIATMYPGFKDAFTQQSQNTQNFLRGDIPMEDRNAITARRTEQLSLGGGGNASQQVAADLGLARVDIMGRGQQALAANVGIMDQISPISRYLTPQSSFVDVNRAIQSMVVENQFDATFAASERDAELTWGLHPDPQKAGMVNLEMERAGRQAANPSQSVLGAGLTGAASGLAGYYGGQQQNAQYQQALGVMGGGSYQAPAYSASPTAVSNTGMFGAYYDTTPIRNLSDRPTNVQLSNTGMFDTGRTTYVPYVNSTYPK